jgi:endo-1,4-beta-xylanase
MSALAGSYSRPTILPWRLVDGGKLVGLPSSEFEMSDLHTHPEATRSILMNETSMLVPLDLHWPGCEPSQGTYSFAKVDQTHAWALATGLVEHHYLYHDGEPGGLMPAWTAGAMTNATTTEAVLRGWLEVVCQRYPTNVVLCTIAGEPLGDGSSSVDGPGGIKLREGIVGRMLGTSQFDIAFDEVRQHHPDAVLIFNEFQLEWAGSDMIAKRAAMLILLDDLLSRDVPVGGVGLQAHIGVGSTFDVDATALNAFLDELQTRGLEAHITELDVQDHASYPVDIGERDAFMAGLVTEFLDVALPHPVMQSVTPWAVSDNDNWYEASGFGRSDALPSRPTTHDRDYQRKAMYYAVQDALERHWS